MLFHADDNGHFDMVRLLLENDAPALACCIKVMTAAAEEGRIEQVEYLVEHFANKGLFLGEALSAASRRGHCVILDYLLDNDASVDGKGRELLLEAAPTGNMGMALHLIQRGTNL